MRSRLPAILCGAALASAPLVKSARADPPAVQAPSAIAVLCAPGDPFGLRVRAELESLGFRVAIFDPGAEPPSRVSLEASARAAGAIAAIRAVPSEHGVEVWIADRVTGKTVLREVSGEDGTADRDAALSLRVVELLRASLLEVTLPGPPRGEVPATPEIRAKMAVPPPAAPAAPQAPTLRLAAAPSLLWSPGGYQASTSLGLDVAWMPSDHVGLMGFAAIPLTRPSVDAPQGRADLSVLLVGGAIRFLFTSRSSRWAPSLDLGMTAVSLRSTGTAAAGFVGTTSAGLTAAPVTRLGLACALTRMLRARVDLMATVVAQGVSIHFAGQEVATWGRPLVLLPSTGFDFGWL